jgi:hypothetical protein
VRGRESDREHGNDPDEISQLNTRVGLAERAVRLPYIWRPAPAARITIGTTVGATLACGRAAVSFALPASLIADGDMSLRERSRAAQNRA